MNINLLLTVGSFLLCAYVSVNAQIANTLPLATIEELKKTFPSMTEDVQFSEGDLDDDNLQDIAAIVNYSDGGVDLECIVILKQIEKGKYRVIGTSSSFEPNRRRTEGAWIEKHSLFANAGGGSYTEYWGARYQFKARGSRFLLIGIETSRGEIEKERPDYKESVNLLSNTVIESDTTGRRTKTVTRRLQQNHAFYLDNFSLEGIDVRGLR